MIKIIILLFSINTFTSCVGPEKKLECASNEAFDENKRICVKSLGANSETLAITKADPAFDYIASTADSPITHSVAVSDDFNNGFVLKWLLTDSNGNEKKLGDDLSLDFNQTGFDPGTYNLVVNLYDTEGINILDSHIWNIIITDSDIPSIVQTITTPINTKEGDLPNIITSTISNPSNLTGINYQWSVNDKMVLGKSGSIVGSSQIESFTFQADPNYYIGLGKYSLKLLLKDNITNFVYASAKWDVNIDLSDFAVVSLGTSGTFTTTTPETSTTLTAINELEISNGGLLFDINFDSNDEQIDICVQVNNINGVDGSGVFVDFFSNGVFLTNSNFSTNDSPICLGQILNNFSFQTPSNKINEIQKISAIVYDKYIGYSSKPSYRGFTQLKKLEWKVNVRQANTPPKIIITDTGLSCNDKTSGTTYLGCELSLSSLSTSVFTVGVFDDDYDPSLDFDKFKIDFFLNGDLLDGAHDLSDSICVHDFNINLNLNRYNCTLVLNPLRRNGLTTPINQTFSLSAVVTDFDSPFSIVSPDKKLSNVVSWQILITDDN